MTAPVSPVAASNNRTLLLGMKAQRMYNYRITAMARFHVVREPELHDHDQQRSRPVS